MFGRRPSNEPLFQIKILGASYLGTCIVATRLMKSGAIALPPFVITAHDNVGNHDLMRHEYGHFIQYLLLVLCSWSFGKAYLLYLFLIGIPSIVSAYVAQKNKSYFHQGLYTEKSANQLSYWFHHKPHTWNFEKYPVYWR
jgi:hypothetical protein